MKDAKAMNRARVMTCAASAALATALAWAGAAPALAQSGIFAGLSGSWSGSGTIRSAGGTSESIRCRATYVTGDDDARLDQKLRCASDSYRFDVESSVTYNEGAGLVKGAWKETTNNVGGLVSGPASPGRIKALVKSSTFTAEMEVVTQGGRQSVVIRPQNMDVTEVSVDLRKN